MRRAVAAVVTAVLVLGVASRADAHDPIIFTADQTTPAAGPRLPDGTISFALYGTLAGGADARGFRATLQAGQQLELTLLIPDLEPERALPDASLPFLTVTGPDGSTSERRPDRRETFAESFSRTNYVRLIEVAEAVPAAGEYGITVAGSTPARFTVAIGSIERFGTPVDDVPNRDEGVTGVQRWYATPPAADAATAAPSTAAAAVAPTAPPVGLVASTGPTTAALPATTTLTTGTAPLVATPTPTPTTAAPATTPASRTRGTIVLLTVIVGAGSARIFLRKRQLRRRRA